MFRLDRDQFQGLAKIIGRSLTIVQTHLELTESRVEQIIRAQLVALMDRFDRFDAGSRTVNGGHGHGAIERHHGRIIDLDQAVVERKDTWPVRGFVILRRAVAGGDGGLKMILAGFVAGGRLQQMIEAARDQRLIPL